MSESTTQDLTLSGAQAAVHSWISQWEEGYWHPLSNLARLTEEVGELARAINHVHGDKKKKSDEADAAIAEELADLTEGEGSVVRAGLKKLALFLKDGELHCIQNFCPHAGAFLGLGDVSGCIVRCPRHSWGFDFTTGSCVTNPRYEVKRYVTKIEDGWVLVGVPDDGNLI